MDRRLAASEVLVIHPRFLGEVRGEFLREAGLVLLSPLLNPEEFRRTYVHERIHSISGAALLAHRPLDPSSGTIPPIYCARSGVALNASANSHVKDRKDRYPFLALNEGVTDLMAAEVLEVSPPTGYSTELAREVIRHIGRSPVVNAFFSDCAPGKGDAAFIAFGKLIRARTGLKLRDLTVEKLRERPGLWRGGLAALGSALDRISDPLHQLNRLVRRSPPSR